MQLYLIHLSDIHFRGLRDSISGRVTQLAKAIESRRGDVNQVIFVVTGDVAFSGTSDQYDIARKFLRDLLSAIGGDPVCIVIPGNHDCDFSAATDVRSMLIRVMQQRPTNAVDDSVVEQCVAVQRAFFTFRNDIASKYLDSAANPLRYDYLIPVGSEFVAIQCYNTAWVSSKNEVGGSLNFPSSMVPENRAASFIISAFHHPYSWLEPMSGKAFRRKLEAVSDLILTGHEHEHDRHMTQHLATAKITSYVEGAVLQETGDPSQSGFNAMLLDITSGEQRFHHFRWNGDAYLPESSIDTWEPLPLQARKLRGVFELQPKFRSWLEDAGIPNLSQSGTKRSFNDIYIVPELLESIRDVNLKRKRMIVKSDDVLGEMSKYSVAFISAPPKSGRTSFAKRLYLEHMSKDAIPVYVDAAEVNIRSVGGTPQWLLAAVEAQYGAGAVERYRQLDREDRVVLVDNIDKSTFKSDIVMEAIHRLSGAAVKVVVIGDDTAGRVTEFSATEAGLPSDSKAFVLQPLNHGLRERLAQRWFPGENDGDEALRSQLLDRVAKTLDTIIGRNYVPPFPIYVVAVLQAFEDGATVDMRASTHGYFYEMLIRLALASGGVAKADFDIRLSFLAHLAYEMFTARKQYFLEPELRASYDRYQTKHDIGGLEYERLIAALVSRGMLARDADRVLFRYPYLYYYFVATHLSRNINTEETRQHIRDLCAHIDRQHSGDILLFLAHLTSDKYIIDCLLSVANDYYIDVEPARLEPSAQSSAQSDVKLTYVDSSIDEARQRRADSQDENSLDPSTSVIPDPDTQRAGAEFAAALETIRILGQILKNFPGSLDAETKLSLTNACYDLGLRCLAVALRDIGADKQTFIDNMMATLRSVYSSLPENKLKLRAEQYLWLVTILGALGTVQVISASVAASELEPTYAKALGNDPSNARKLIDTALKLDIAKTFPRAMVLERADEMGTALLARTILKVIVLEHFDRFSVPFQEKQRVCAKLGIEIQQVRLAPPPP